MKFILLCSLLMNMGISLAQPTSMSIADFFNNATYENMDQICRQFYGEEVHFEDPLGRIDGIEKLVKYYKNLYENLISIKFEPINHFVNADEQVFVWKMHLKHKKVGAGETITVDGVSVFRYKAGRVVYHRDYFDLGAMIYEKIPVLGSLIKWIREKAHGQSH